MNNVINQLIPLLLLSLLLGCKAPELALQEANQVLPEDFAMPEQAPSVATINWREYFADPQLIALIDTALRHNQELNIV